ncbi:putative outer membrane lipoprotein [Klebsiella aerogenes]|nr:putative outer membrane lipoprotein [Klebsiella aerogenes]
MKSYGFTESNGDWSLGLSDSILFDKNDYRLRPDSRQQITTMASRLAATGITHSRLEGHTIITVRIAITKPCRLSAPIA